VVHLKQWVRCVFVWQLLNYTISDLDTMVYLWMDPGGGYRRLGCGEGWGGVFWWILSGIFFRALAWKNVEFSVWSGDLVDVERCTFDKYSEYAVRVMAFVMQASWCLKFWTMTKTWGQFALASRNPNSGGLAPHPSRDLRPCLDMAC